MATSSPSEGRNQTRNNILACTIPPNQVTTAILTWTIHPSCRSSARTADPSGCRDGAGKAGPSCGCTCHEDPAARLAICDGHGGHPWRAARNRGRAGTFDGDVGHKREEASEGEAEGGYQGHQQHGQAQLTCLGDGWKHHYGVPGMKPEGMLRIQNPNMRKT